MDESGQKPDIEALREQLIGDLMPFGDGAAVLNKHPKTLKKMNPPIVYVGRTPYLPKEPFRTWVLNGCKPLDPEPHGRGRRRAA